MSGRAAGLLLVRTPDRPGPGPIPDAVLRALDLTIQRRVAGLLPGNNRSSALGAGTELAQVRPYEPGDDVREIDWNVTARTTQPHIRVRVAERVLTTWMLYDTSPSMAFGTADRRKADVAEGVAIAVGHIATRRGNRLGICTFGDAVPRIIPPAPGRPGMLGLFVMLQHPEAGQSAGPALLAESIGRVNGLAGQSKVVVVVSDFRGPLDWSRAMVGLCSRHSVIAVEIRDPREQELPNVGDLCLVDPETGRQLRVDTSSRRLRERFASAAADERAAVAAELRHAGARHVVLSTAGDWLRTLTLFLKRQEAVR
jgi:uncharacterized protein (DUF58 family)